MFERKADFTIVASDVPLLAAPDLRAAYATCREITRVASKTFYLASLFLSPEKRRVIWAVYAFCRTADDVVDRTAPAAERLSAIDELERKLLAAVAGRASEPIFVEWRHYGEPAPHSAQIHWRAD